MARQQKPRVLRGFCLFCLFQYSGLGVTDAPSESAGQTRVFAMSGLDSNFSSCTTLTRLCRDDGQLEGGTGPDFVGVGNVIGFGDLRVLVGITVEEKADS